MLKSGHISMTEPLVQAEERFLERAFRSIRKRNGMVLGAFSTSLDS